ncbi:MAG: TonB-dependent receptor plug domain-containing protein [Bacteroidota bacterium]
MSMSLPSPRWMAPSLLGLVLVLGTGCAGSGPTRADSDSSTPNRPADTITAADLEDQPAEGVEQLLQGRVAGARVFRNASGGLVVQIRGATSIRGNSQPLFVIDGLPVRPGPDGALYGINPRDIESIRVLKNAADTAMYGARGANGVVVVQTKRGGR